MHDLWRDLAPLILASALLPLQTIVTLALVRSSLRSAFVLAQIIPYAILALGASSSPRSTAILDGFNAFLQRNNRIITVLLGLIFGTWFLIKALKQLRLI